MALIQYRSLDKSNLKVSTLCLGTRMFGDQTAQHDAADIVAHAHASGVNHFDTADSYSQGASEAMVDDLVRPGHPSAPCYANPVYPLIGRFTGEHSH